MRRRSLDPYDWHASLRLAHDIYGVGGSYPGDPPLERISGTTSSAARWRRRRSLCRDSFSLAASYSREKHWLNVDHTQDYADSKISVSGARERQHLRYFLAYEVQNIGDYWGNKQTAGVRAERRHGDDRVRHVRRTGGVARARDEPRIRRVARVHADAVVRVRAYDVAALRLPGARTGLYGQPPWQLIGDVRVRVAKQILLDLSRQYFFNFANERWMPQFGFQVSP